MPSSEALGIHGSFAFSFLPEYTLFKASGAWNLACARAFDTVLLSRIDMNPATRRCIIGDARDWGFETPECAEQTRNTNASLVEYYSDLFIAFIINRENSMFVQHMLNHASNDFPDTHHVHYVHDLPEAVSWLRSEGFRIPDLQDGDFPVPVPPDEYLS